MVVGEQCRSALSARQTDDGGHTVARQNKSTANKLEAPAQAIECETLEPLRKVVRELKRPDGSTLRVEVPVYPPFRLKEKEEKEEKERQKKS